MPCILVVDDDPNVRDVISRFFTQLHYDVICAKDGMHALEMINGVHVDLAIIDVMMPFLDGYALTKQLREQFTFPILLITAKGQIEDKERGYLAGTDDYVVKPFDVKELKLRVEALLRRARVPLTERTLRIGEIRIIAEKYEIQTNDRTLLLPLKEFELLSYLVEHKGTVQSREQIIENVWGLDYAGDERTVDVHIKRLRARLATLAPSVCIKTVRGIGYAIEETI